VALAITTPHNTVSKEAVASMRWWGRWSGRWRQPVSTSTLNNRNASAALA